MGRVAPWRPAPRRMFTRLSLSDSIASVTAGEACFIRREAATRALYAATTSAAT